MRVSPTPNWTPWGSAPSMRNHHSVAATTDAHLGGHAPSPRIEWTPASAPSEQISWLNVFCPSPDPVPNWIGVARLRNDLSPRFDEDGTRVLITFWDAVPLLRCCSGGLHMRRRAPIAVWCRHVPHRR
jgi:hypothetical protein